MKSVTLPLIKMRNLVCLLGLSAVFAFNGPDAHALPASYYTSTSKLAQGKWVKIKTSGEGVHQITYARLKEWGFNDPSKVHVYGFGATVLANDIFSTSIPDDVPLTYTHHENNKLFFYSSGVTTTDMLSQTDISIQHNLYSTEVYYLLSDRELTDEELTQTKVAYDASNKPYTAHLSLEFIEEELQNPSNGGAYFLGKDIPYQSAVDLPFTVKDYGKGNTTWETATLYANYGALYNFSTKVNIDYPAGLPTPTTGGPGAYSNMIEHTMYKIGYSTLTFNTKSGGTIPDGTHVFRAKHPNGNQTFLAMDYAWFIYPRLNKLNGESQLSMYFPGVSGQNNFSLTATSTTRVINVTSHSNIFEHTTNFVSATANLSGSFDRTYSVNNPACHLVAYDTNRPQKEVEFVENVANQDYHNLATPDMVILTTAELHDAAENLAQAHREYDKMDVLVIDHDKLFNEFSAATPDIMGYRRFIKMLYDRDPEKLKYVIMYGPSHWDNRAITIGKKDRLLVYETSDPLISSVSSKAFGTDSYLGMLSDSYNPAKVVSTFQDIAVGRIPVEHTQQGLAVNNKFIKYMQSAPTAAIYNNAMIMSDDGDDYTHLIQAEAVGITLNALHPAMTVVRAHNSLYPIANKDAKILRSVAINNFKQGTGFYMYIGHGNQDAFGEENLWSRKMANDTEIENPPFAFLSTCDAFTFDTGRDNVAQEMILKEDGGAIGIIAACRTVYSVKNQKLALSAARVYASMDETYTMGRLWLDARNSLLSTSGYAEDDQINTLCYNFGGDPALRLFAPTYSVRIDASQIEDYVLEPMQPTTVSGTIVDNMGNDAEDFNGTVTLKLYDAPFSIAPMKRGESIDLNPIALDQDVLMSKTVEVVNGKFTATFVAPVPVHEDGTNRLVFYADANDGRRADGIFSQLSVVAPANETVEAIGNAPTIDDMSLFVISEKDGSARLTAQGTVDFVGLNISPSIGAASSLVIDGSTRVEGIKESIEMTGENAWSLQANLANLDKGNHTATLTLADNAGRRVSQTVSFNIGSNEDIVLVSDTETVRDNVTFDVDHALGQVSESRIVIEDRMGNTVYTRQGVSFPCRVNMAEIQGLENGHYNAFVQIKGSEGRGSSQALPLVYIKK